MPFIPLKAAAGVFGDPQHIGDDGWQWAAIDTKHRLRPGMFVAQVVGKSMEPTIPDGSYCLFSSPVTGSREGKIVLVQLQDEVDAETGQRFTVKKYHSSKIADGDSWHHENITLDSLNPKFKAIELSETLEGQVSVTAEFVEVVRSSTSSEH